MSPARRMKCPICKRKVEKSDSEYPFCSGRCRTMDLGNWVSGTYRVSVPLPDTDESSSPSALGETAENTAENRDK